MWLLAALLNLLIRYSLTVELVDLQMILQIHHPDSCCKCNSHWGDSGSGAGDHTDQEVRRRRGLWSRLQLRIQL